MGFATMASLLFLVLSLSISGLLLFHPLITFANQNSNNSHVYIAVYTFLFFLVPFQFFSAVILLLVHVAAPQSAFFIKHLTRATQILISITLLLGVPLMIHTLLPEILTSHTLRVMAVIGAAAVIYKYSNPYERYVNLAGQTSGSFVPALMALCISMGSFFFIETLLSLSKVNHGITRPIQLLFLSLNCLTFFLAMLLLFLRIAVPADGPQNHPIDMGMIKNLVEAMAGMSLTTTVLIAFYMLMFVP